MQEIMIAIVLGIAVGCSDLLNYNVKKWLSRFSTVSLFIMLLCLGAKIGCDAELLGKLDQLGGKSLVMAVFIIGGSVLMLWLVLKLFAKRQPGRKGAMNNGLCYFYIYRFRNRRRIFLFGIGT